ncbi:L-rhamnose/proton symporter RhaT [Mangrovibacterium lignilyticum]|uniref:L-rhamnose/proton symporter RhaT n=1 Tax=Mangrovibacterium lignilyticum TaxID=2668052 RepID=UPI0013D8C435|nr:L-rhamnose/proton symporter RhaT [Mangrovibacterium lignilyticum]
MVPSSPILGTMLHAIGGVSASSCYVPFQKTKNWSWGTFWLVQAMFAWILMPVIIGLLTVNDFFTILKNAPSHALWGAFILGAVYGFGSMSFGVAIRYIGYSLTYTLAIGISAIVGTVLPLVIFGGLVDYFTNPGGGIVLAGMLVSVIGVAGCGWAGFRREKELAPSTDAGQKSNMMIGLFLTIVAGVLSGVFNISLEFGQPIADMAAANGAGHFEGNAKLIVSTAGCWVVNMIWFLVLGIQQNTLREFTGKLGIENKVLFKNLVWSALAGTMWFLQFFFYGLGHVSMGRFQFASWVLHMSMLIFFSYIIGVLMKEWKNIHRSTYVLLLVSLFILVISFVIIAYGSMVGESKM